MAIIKCKMCGGDLNLVEGSTVCECEYCGTKQTVPSADNEKKLTLFGRAGRLLRACEFDKAAGVFETIVADFPQEAEAYWGLVLCKYGIEYVDDPATGKKIPTCHRSSFDSVLDDPNFEQACENTDAVARRVYRDEARQIEDLRQAILQVSGKEEPYDVFISYKETDENGERTLDSVIAQDIYKELTDEGYRVFFSRISLEDKLGTEYEPYIFAALNSAKVMLVVGTDYENFDSVWVKNEWSRFLKLIAKGEKKTLIPVFKNMDAYDMPKEFAKLAAQDMGKVGAMQDLVRGVEKIAGKKKTEPAAPVQQPTYISNEADAKTAAAIKRGYMALEDYDWNKAKDYFDQALALDAECAEAYLGLALADAKCANENTYISRSCGIRPEQEKKSLFPDRERVAAAVQSHTVSGFLNEDEIRDLFRFDLVYYSDVKGTEKIAEQEKTVFRNNRNLTRALRFAKDETKARLDRFQSTLFSGLDDNVEKAKQREAAAKDEKAKAYEAHLAAAEQKLVELHRQAEIQREAAYQSACRKQAAAKTIAEYQEAIGTFLEVEEYRDSDERIAQCRAAIEDIKEQERIRKEAEAKAAAEEAERKRKAEAEEAERQRILKERAAKERKAKNKKIGIIVGILAVVAAAVFLVVTKVVIPNNRYKAAEALLNAGQYKDAIVAFKELDGYKDSVTRIDEANEKIAEEKAEEAAELEARNAAAYEEAEALFEAGDYADAAAAFQALGSYSDSRDRYNAATKEIGYSDAEELLAAGYKAEAAIAFYKLDYKDSREQSLAIWDQIAHRSTIVGAYAATVGVKTDGTIISVPEGYLSKELSGWTDIVDIQAGGTNVHGLKSDGTVVFAGLYPTDITGASNWTDIVQVSGNMTYEYDAHEFIVGLRPDGTVIATGDNRWGQCDVESWDNIVAIATGSSLTVGLRTDGTVCAVGNNEAGQCDVSDWRDIIAIAAGSYHTVGLKRDGTVVATGNNRYMGYGEISNTGPCDVSKWTDIIAIAAGGYNTIGLKEDGTVVAVGQGLYGACDVADWKDIVAINADNTTVGLKADGTVVSTGKDSADERDVSGWAGIRLPNT